MLSSVPPIQLSLGLSPPPTSGGSVTSGSSSGPQGWSFTATKPRLSPQPQGVLPVDATHHSPVIQALLGGRLSHKDRDYLLHLWFIPSLELGLSSSWFPNGLSLQLALNFTIPTVTQTAHGDGICTPGSKFYLRSIKF